MFSIRVLHVIAIIIFTFSLVDSIVEHCADDVNVCNGDLPPNAKCSGENNMSKKCQCEKGYRMSLDIDCKTEGSIFSCQDIDECTTSNGFCEQVCHNEPGSYKCLCPNGSKLMENGLNCEAATPDPCEFESKTEGKSVALNRIYEGKEDKERCEAKCKETMECSFWHYGQSVCSLYKSPTLSVFRNENGNMNEQVCQDYCAQNKKCVSGEVNGEWCTLFDSKPTKFLTQINLVTIFHKVDMNCI